LSGIRKHPVRIGCRTTQLPLPCHFYFEKRNMRKSIIYLSLLSLSFLLLASCTKLGYGVLLWSLDDPPIESGSVLPVYVKSNIEKKWIVGFPETETETETYDKKIKFEIPFTQMEFSGNKKKAIEFAQEFAPHAKLYAENLLDGLPIRAEPDNNARRVYRLREGEIIKILSLAEHGTPPISTTGDPLQGDWYKVMTNDGVSGFCFSNRLNLFNRNMGALNSISEKGDDLPDSE